MIAYRMDVATEEELAAQDPFGGSGVFLPCSGSGEDILAALERKVDAGLPAVAWPGRGAWVDCGGLDHGATGSMIRELWEDDPPGVTEED